MNSHSLNEIKCLSVPSMGYLHTLCVLYLAVASHASQPCDTSPCPSHPVAWAVVVSLITQGRNWCVFMPASKAAFKASAHVNSFSLLEKDDYTHLRRFVVFCRFLDLIFSSFSLKEAALKYRWKIKLTRNTWLRWRRRVSFFWSFWHSGAMNRKELDY